MLYRAIETPSDEPVQYVGVYALRWDLPVDPEVGFIPIDVDEALAIVAPQLLESLEWAMEWVDLDHQRDHPNVAPEFADAYDAARRAIAKAKGERV